MLARLVLYSTGPFGYFSDGVLLFAQTEMELLSS
jgi:hypothetical protein